MVTAMATKNGHMWQRVADQIRKQNSQANSTIVSSLTMTEEKEKGEVTPANSKELGNQLQMLLRCCLLIISV